MAKVKQQRMSRELARRETISGYLFLLPSLLFFIVFVVYPMIMCVVTSLTDATMTASGGSNFIGLKTMLSCFRMKFFLRPWLIP